MAQLSHHGEIGLQENWTDANYPRIKFNMWPWLRTFSKVIFHKEDMVRDLS